MTIDPQFHTTAEELAGILEAKLAGIRTANGFQTEIGTTVFRGRRQINEEQMPCVVIVEGDDRPLDDDGKGRSISSEVYLNQHYVFEAFDFGNPDHPNDQAHKMIRDMKRAIFAKDDVLKKKIKYMRYSGRLIGSREEGTNIVTTLIEVNVGFLEDLSAA